VVPGKRERWGLPKVRVGEISTRERRTREKVKGRGKRVHQRPAAGNLCRKASGKSKWFVLAEGVGGRR